VDREEQAMALRVAVAACALAMTATAVSAQPAPTGRMLSQEQMDGLAHKHDGYYGALAPQNLAKKRPKAPFDVTGAWFVDLHEGFDKFMFGPPYPEFSAPGQQALKDSKIAAENHERYRDSIGECFPAGMPLIMTRVWPINMVQLPTAIFMMFGFTNSLRTIYLDGRGFPDADSTPFTYNGVSIGHWEGNTLVVQTKYMDPKEHWIDRGIPIDDQFEITERMRLLEGGKILEIAYSMTDPKMWKGEWRSTKRWIRQDYSDIPEVECLPSLNKNLPSTAEGAAAMDARAAAAKAAAAK
jgi:hypothetical protein